MSSPKPLGFEKQDGQYVELHYDSQTTIPKSPRTPVSFTSITNLRTVGVIIGSFIGAVIFAIGHHIYLAAIEGHMVYPRSQFWIKNIGNLFSQIVAIFLGFSITSAMTQVTWRILRKQAVKIGYISDLFSLPSYESIVLLAPSIFRSRRVILPLLYAVVIQALFVVSAIAPNSLSVGPRPPTNTPLNVSTLDFSQGGVHSIINPLIPGQQFPSPFWDESVTTAMVTPPEVMWKAPTQCTGSCVYELVYHALGVQCRNMTDSEITIGLEKAIENYPKGWTTYAGISSLLESTENNMCNAETDYRNYGTDLGSAYNLSIFYFPPTSSPDDATPYATQPSEAITCDFRNATYKLNFNSTASQISVNTSLVEYDEVLGSTSYCFFNGTEDPVPTCWQRGVNTRATAETFARVFVGTIVQANSTDGGTTVEFNLWNWNAIQTVFSAGGAFHVNVANLTEGMQDLFTNLTYSLIPRLGHQAVVTATVSDGSNVWLYSVHILWAVYAPALGISLFLGLLGLGCIRANGTSLDADFATFLLTTRNAQLDRAFEHVSTSEDIKDVKLRHQHMGVFLLEEEDEERKPLYDNTNSP